MLDPRNRGGYDGVNDDNNIHSKLINNRWRFYMKVGYILALMMVVLLIVSAGCQVMADIEVSEETESTDLSEVPLSEAMEVTDEDELEALWRDYLYFAITTVLNTEEYAMPSDIEPHEIAQYCWFQYLEDKNFESSPKLFPLEVALDLVEKYFNTRSIKLEGIDDAYYDAEREGFTFNNRKKEIPSYLAGNSWGIRLEEVTRYSDGHIVATLAQYMTNDDDLAERIFTCELAARADGSLYFDSGGWQFVDHDSVNIQGKYIPLKYGEGLEKLYEQFYEVQVIGEIGGQIILMTGLDEVPVVALDEWTLEVSARLDPMNYQYEDGTNPESFPAMVKEDKVVLCLDDLVLVYNGAMEFLEEIPLPGSMILDGEEDRVQGYDISSDFERLVYADREGLKLVDYRSGTERLLSETLQAKGDYPDGRQANRYFYNPRFVDGDSKVIVTLSGYDYNSGFVCYDLTDDSYQVFDEYLEGIDTSNVYQNNGMVFQIETEASRAGERGDESKNLFYISYYNFHTGERQEFQQVLTGGNIDYVLFRGMVYNGRNQVAFQTFTSNPQTSHVNLLDLDSGLVKGNLLSLDGAQLQIIGVLNDGRILCGYNRNPAENGLVIIV
jgi:hypothetical protein